jgi:hypothetical protein
VLSIFFMETNRSLIEKRAKVLIRNRERKAGEPVVERMLEILNFEPPEPRRGIRQRLYGDLKTGLDYQTLFEFSGELADLMVSWLAGGCRLNQWKLRQRLEDDLNCRRLFLSSDRDDWVEYDFSSPIREEADLGLGGGFKLDTVPGRTGAVALFFQFVTGPFQRDVGRCKRCAKFFWNQSGHENKQYCTPRCASADTAKRVTHDKRVRDHEGKLASVRRAIKKFEGLSPERRARFQNWKTWVKEQCGPAVTRNFITRAINAGELDAPICVAGLRDDPPKPSKPKSHAPHPPALL